MIFFDETLTDENGSALLDELGEEITGNKILSADYDLWSIRRDGDVFSLYINDVLFQEKTIIGVPSPVSLSDLLDLTPFVCRDPYQLTNFYMADHIIGVDPDTWQRVPIRYEAVRLLKDDSPIAGGLITHISSPVFSSGEEVRKYTLSVSSWEAVLNNRYISESYTNKTTQYIVEDLFDKYITEEGFLLGNISIIDGGITYESYDFTNGNLADILQELANDVSASFYIDADRYFYFCTKDEFATITPPEHIKVLKYDEDPTGLRTVQLITGIQEETSLQEETIYWGTDQSSITLAYPVSSISEITVNSVPVDFGISGLESDDDTKVFLFTYNSNTLAYNSASSGVVATDVVVVSYYGQYEATYQSENSSLIAEIKKLNGTSGRIENILNDNTLTSIDDAAEKGGNLLDQYGITEKKVTLETQDFEKSAILNQWPLSYPDYNIDDTFVVVERSIRPFTQEAFMISITLSKKNFIPNYANLLRKRKKSVGKDAKVYKRSNERETIQITETTTINTAGIIPFPGVESGEIFSPNFPEIYPVRGI